MAMSPEVDKSILGQIFTDPDPKGSVQKFINFGCIEMKNSLKAEASPSMIRSVNSNLCWKDQLKRLDVY